MRQHDSDPLVSLGGQRVARAAANPLYPEAGNVYADGERPAGSDLNFPASEAEAWKDLVEALTDYGPRHPAKPKPLSDRMNVGE